MPNLDKHELKLLTAAGCIAPHGTPVRVTLLAGVFERPGKCQQVIDQLRISGLITVDVYQGVLRVLPDRVWQALNQYGVTPELFTSERPLDAALAEISRQNMLKNTGAGEIAPPSRGPVAPPALEAPPPKVVETRGIPGVSHAPMPSMPMPKPMSSPGHRHVHETCNSGDQESIHGHEHGHEVGELARRTTAQIMADLRKLAPGLSEENLKHWEARIEREDAALVNACVRQGYLQRRQIRNMPGWLNKNYLTAIQKAGSAVGVKI